MYFNFSSISCSPIVSSWQRSPTIISYIPQNTSSLLPRYSKYHLIDLIQQVAI